MKFKDFVTSTRARIHLAWLEVIAAFYTYRCEALEMLRKIQEARVNGLLLDAEISQQAKKRAECNHRKGGSFGAIAAGRPVNFPKKGPNKEPYAVIKHQMINGDWWVYCLRCGKQWKPPIRRKFNNDREFYQADEVYQAAVEFDTDNASSSSVLCQFVINGSIDQGTELVRRRLAES